MIPSTGLKRTHHLHCTINADERILKFTMPIYVFDRGYGKDLYPLRDPANRGGSLLASPEYLNFRAQLTPRNRL